MDEARLERITHGVAPVTEGWFVVNALDAQWIHHPDFGWQCPFEANGPVVRQRDDLEPVRFPQLGINLSILERGKPKGLYHREGQQEDFLVLRGECLLIVEGEERPLKQWDFFHSPPGTEHVFVGTSDEPCVVLAVGIRLGYPGLFYPRDPAAVRHGAAAEVETASGAEAYAPHGHWQPGERPPGLR
ncbi:MAG TPA: cupin domain-containing protein [Gemmatimonadaceae bacterium]|nr:cupin domain-containing protein [Gemmatimonadaceae bacterium]